MEGGREGDKSWKYKIMVGGDEDAAEIYVYGCLGYLLILVLGDMYVLVATKTNTLPS